MSVAPRFLGRDARMIMGQSWVYRVIPVLVPKALFDWMNEKLTRFGARKLSREFLAQEYEKAHGSAVKALERVADPDFDKHVKYPDWDPLLSGDVTVERLFHYVKTHFDSHADEIRQVAAAELRHYSKPEMPD
jgi:hypothetical protein